MDRTGEGFIRAAVHDLSNTFAGIQGILDLSDPAQPLPPLQRERLGALLSDGFQVLQRTRHLALGTRPEALNESGSAWRGALEQQLKSLEMAFRCNIQVRHRGEPDHDHWPGELFRGWTLAVTRQVLPFFRPTEDCPDLVIETEADPREWRMVWSPIGSLPDSLSSPETTPRDIGSFWARDIGQSLGAEMRFDQGRVKARIPRF